MDKNFKRVKFACYTTNIAMSVVANLSPILFLTFHNLYSISYSLLGALVLINFGTQLLIDLVFSFFSHKFDICKAVKITPFLTTMGLVAYAVIPLVFPSYAFFGILCGTLIFSASGGLAEVLISPVIASLPSDDPDREMSKLHSVYAWGVVPVIILSTVFLSIFGNENWQFLALIYAIIPLIAFILFLKSKIPQMETPQKVSGTLKLLKNKKLWLCVSIIFFGGAAECIMAQWCSGYIEQVFELPKIWGDVFGVALFAVMLGIGRTLYAKRGKNIKTVLLAGSVGAVICYLITALSDIPAIGLFACAFTGLCVSMLWPGSLIVAAEYFPAGGVFIYAMMASGGDMGAALGPQLIGIITDTATKLPALVEISTQLSITPEQLGLKLGMLVGMLFPLSAIPLLIHIKKSKRNNLR